MHVREPAVAGTFYPSNKQDCLKAVQDLLEANCEPARSDTLALVVPHAGWIFSGSMAAKAYSTLVARRESIKHVVLLGPSHRIPLTGVAAPDDDVFRTPLGAIRINQKMIAALKELPFVESNNLAHTFEHSLEVQLPFLQHVLGDFDLTPLVIGQANTNDIAQLLEHCGVGEDTLLVVSTDLSHYLSYDEARQVDSATAMKISHLESALSGEQACGHIGLNGLLQFARIHHLAVEKVGVNNSGDTAGDRGRVVGYGAFLVH